MTRSEFIQRAVLTQVGRRAWITADTASFYRLAIARAACMADILAESGHAPWGSSDEVDSTEAADEFARGYYRRNPQEPVPERLTERARKNAAEFERYTTELKEEQGEAYIHRGPA